MEIEESARKKELLVHYLYNKANGSSDCGGIPEYNLYGEKEPWEIWEECNGGTQLAESSKDLYVFTKVKKKDCKRSCLDRMVGTGRWRGVGSSVKVPGNKNSDGTTMRLVGKEQKFWYLSHTPLDHRWIMIEYSLDASTLKHAKFQDYVLCQIKKEDGSENKKRLKQEEALGLRVVSDKSMDSKRERICNKRQEISLEGDQGKQPELSCNNDNNGTGRTTMTKTEEVADIDTELPWGDGPAIIDLSNDDEEPNNGNAQVNNIGAKPVEKQVRDGPTIIDLSDDDEEPNNDNARVNNIGTKPVEKQLPSLKSPLGETDCKESAVVSEGNESLNVNNAVGNRTHWSDTFAKELLRGQEQPMQEPEIEMLPNLFYQGITGCELLTKKSKSGQE